MDTFSRAPWITHRGSVWSTDPSIDKSKRTNMVASISDKWRMPEGEKAANAILIASAPDLLAACEFALEGLEWSNSGERHDEKEMADKLRTAIEKAKGLF